VYAMAEPPGMLTYTPCKQVRRLLPLGEKDTNNDNKQSQYILYTPKKLHSVLRWIWKGITIFVKIQIVIWFILTA